MLATMNTIIPLVSKWLYLEDITVLLCVCKSMKKYLDNYIIWEQIFIRGDDYPYMKNFSETIMRFIQKYNTKKIYFEHHCFNNNSYLPGLIRDINVKIGRFFMRTGSDPYRDVIKAYKNITIDELYVLQSQEYNDTAYLSKINVRKLYINTSNTMNISHSILYNFKGIRELHIEDLDRVFSKKIATNFPLLEILKINTSFDYYCFTMLPHLRKLKANGIFIDRNNTAGLIPENVKEIYIAINVPDAIPCLKMYEQKEFKRIVLGKYTKYIRAN
jgi:hypothetical protein